MDLINIDFGGTQGAEVGYGAIGFGAEDYWNATGGPAVAIQNLRFANGGPSRVGLSVRNATLRQANGADDSMYSTYIGASRFPPYPLATLTNLPVGKYDVYVYGHGSATNGNGVYTLSSGGINYGTNATLRGLGWNSARWQEGVQFVVFRDIQITNPIQSLQLQVLPGGTSNSIISGMQIVGYTDSAPTVLRELEDTQVQLGGSVIFSVAAVGTQPLQYEWFFGDQSIPGVHGSSVVVTNAQESDVGLYWVTLSNAFGSVRTSKAALSVSRLSTDSLINVNFGDKPGKKAGAAAIGFSNRDYWNAFYTSDLLPSGLTNLQSAARTRSEIGLTVTPPYPGNWSNGAADPMYATYMYLQKLAVTVTNLPVGVYDIYAYGHYWGVLDPSGTNPIAAYNLVVNGVDFGTKAEITNDGWDSPVWREGVQYVVFRNIPFTNSPSELTLSALPESVGFLAGMQLIRYTNRAPVIITQPGKFSVPAGTTVTFTSSVVGSYPMRYQWLFNGAAIAGATSSSLTVSNVQAFDAGDYSVTVSNDFGLASGVGGHLLVNSLPRNALLNIDFAALPGSKTGYAAIGLSFQDYWNAYSFPWANAAAMPNLLLSDGTVSTVGLTVSGGPGEWGNASGDPMYNGYIYGRGLISVTITNLLPSNYDLYIYGHGGATAFPGLSSANGVYAVSAGAVNYGTNSNVSGAGWDSAVWQEGLQFVVFRSVQITNTAQPLTVSVLPGDAGFSMISGLQILSTSPPPVTNVALAISTDGSSQSQTLIINWPRSSPNVTLQVTDEIVQGQWRSVSPDDVTQTPSGSEARVAMSASEKQKFFRLIAP